jgi:Tfp pilus assembly protein PilF
MEAIKAFESGMVAFQGGQHAEAEKSVRACIKANPNHARGCNAAAYFCIERRELKEAGVLLKKAVTTDPQMVRALAPHRTHKIAMYVCMYVCMVMLYVVSCVPF